MMMVGDRKKAKMKGNSLIGEQLGLVIGIGARSSFVTGSAGGQKGHRRTREYWIYVRQANSDLYDSRHNIRLFNQRACAFSATSLGTTS